MQPYKYRDYREFLHDWFWLSKEGNPKISFRYISRRLELRAPNHFHLVIAKKRHLSRPTFEKALTITKVGVREKHFLRLLFKLAHCDDAAVRAEIEQQVDLLAGQVAKLELASEQYSVISHALAWHIKMASVRFEGIPLEKVLEEVKAAAMFQIDDVQLGKSIDLLVTHGLLSFEGQAKNCQFDGADITTKWNFDRDEVKKHHAGNLAMAQQAIGWPIEKRFFSSVTIPSNGPLRDEIIADLRALCLKVLEASRQLIAAPEDCHQVTTLEMAMFPYFDFSKT